MIKTLRVGDLPTGISFEAVDLLLRSPEATLPKHLLRWRLMSLGKSTQVSTWLLHFDLNFRFGISEFEKSYYKMDLMRNENVFEDITENKNAYILKPSLLGKGEGIIIKNPESKYE